MAIAAAVSLAAGYDLARPPSEQFTAKALLGGVNAYQAMLSPVLGASGVRCRFSPTCSHYAAASIEKYGALRGVGRSTWRLLRCAPWTPRGTVDPP